MNKNATIFTQGYHFLSEGIILFYFLLVWVRFTDVETFPYWNYFLVLILSAVLFSVAVHREIQQMNLLVAPIIIFLLFYVVNFPVEVSAIFSLILSYRYYRLDKAEILHSETTYLGISALLSGIIYLFVRDAEIVWVLLLHYAVLFLGYYGQHLLQTVKRNQFAPSFAVMFLLLIGGGGIITLFYSEVFSRVFGFIWNGILFITVQIASLFAFGIRNLPTNPPEVDFEGADSGVHKSELGASATEAVEGIAAVHLIIVFLLLILFIYLAYRMFRRPSGEKSKALQTTGADLSAKDGGGEERFNLRSIFTPLVRKPDHPARKLVYDFEKKLSKTDYRRHRFETVENWLQRIGGGTDLPIYQQVRYGKKSAEDAEIKELKEELRALEEKLRSEE